MADPITLRDRRRARVLRFNDAGGTLQGIDHIDVLNEEDVAGLDPTDAIIFVVGLTAWPPEASALVPGNFLITRGSGTTAVLTPTFVQRLDEYLVDYSDPGSDGPVTAGVVEIAAAENAAIHRRAALVVDTTAVLVLYLWERGDDAPYTLSLVEAGTTDALAGTDPVLRTISLSFAASGEAETEVRTAVEVGPVTETPPELDYLAKDFASLRQLMLDRLATTLPAWQEPSVVDMGHTLVDLLAYVGDYLSYHQDAAANEAYLHTARLRSSVRRHARLLDYRMHDGNNARVWVALTATSDNTVVPVGTAFLTEVADLGLRVDAEDEYAEALVSDPIVYESMHAFTAWVAWNEGWFYDWAGAEAVIPQGATAATLRLDGVVDGAQPAAGQVWILEEIRSPDTGKAADADPTRRHALRVLSAEAVADPIEPDLPLWQLTWHQDDALPFEVVLGPAEYPRYALRGNVLLADHGRTRTAESLTPAQASERRYRPRMPAANVTFAEPYDAAEAATRGASATLVQDPREAMPQVALEDSLGAGWVPVQDLLGSDAYTREFVAEVGADGWTRLRFGDDDHGAAPAEGAVLTATWRQGNGPDGNIGAEALQHYVSTTSIDISAVRNPLPSQGGTLMETIDDVRRFAPYAFGDTRRAVTLADYVTVLEDRDDVQSALASKVWTGSWSTVSIVVDRAGDEDVDEAYLATLQEYLEDWRLMGVDVEVRGPTYVGLDVRMYVDIDEDYPAPEVLADLRRAFSCRTNADGTTGFFHPDNHTFGETLYFSSLVARALSVRGVTRVYIADTSAIGTEPTFRRHTDTATGALDVPLVATDDEVFRCDSDPDNPAYGSIEFVFPEAT